MHTQRGIIQKPSYTDCNQNGQVGLFYLTLFSSRDMENSSLQGRKPLTVTKVSPFHHEYFTEEIAYW